MWRMVALWNINLLSIKLIVDFLLAQKLEVQKMSEFIIEYWLEFLFGIFSTGMIAWCRRLQRKLKQRQAEQDALKEGMKAILHDKLFQICNTYLSLGYIPVKNSEEILDNAKMIYDAYHGIGGNGTGTTIYEKFSKLHIRNPQS